MKNSRRNFIKNLAISPFIFSRVRAAIKNNPKLAQNYYVSAIDGNDANDGSLNNPFKTLNKAASLVVAGDTVKIKAGNYNERIVFSTTGTQTAPIKFIAIESGVVLDGTGIVWNPPNAINPYNGLFDLYGINYVQIIGIKIINSSYAGFFMENCTNISIINCQTDDTVSSGIGIWSCDSIIIDNNTIQKACNGGGQECISVVTSSNCEVKNNEIFNNIGGALGGEGIDVKQGSHHVLVHHNHIHNINNRVGLYIDAYDSYTHHIEVYNNLIHNCSESGIAVASEGGGLLENVKIYNNISYSNLYGGIEIGGWTTVAGTTTTPIHSITIINNTCYANSDGINIDNAFAEGIIVANNICSQNSGLQIVIGATPALQINITNNLIDGMHITTGNNAIISSAQFVAANMADFHLQNTSPAINAGILSNAPNFDYDNNPRNDAAIDIGAFEYRDLIFKNGFEP